jgi:peptidoglycan-associated lipoprotein
MAAAVAIFATAGCATTEPEAIRLPEADEIPGAAPPPARTPAKIEFSEFDAEGLPVVPGTGRRVERTFYFEFDQSVLAAESLDALELHAKALIAHPDHIVVIEGHADERGSREYNLALGERRADVVRAFLIAAGVSPRQIQTVSYGEERPDVTGGTESAWSQNRRAFLDYTRDSRQIGTR